jgi:D-alanyl-D-alanine endopeptidase (penicillin-binding protein 7)
MILRFILLFCLVCPAYASYGLFSYAQERYEYSKNVEEQRSIASVTKLFTAYTIINSGVNLSEKVPVKGKSTGRFNRGFMIERYELMRAMLMSSDNLAAESLAHSYPNGYNSFITDVNNDIQSLGLRNTIIVDSTGLLAGNKSTVNDLSQFLLKLSTIDVIKRLSTEKFYIYQYQKGKKTVKINMRNTNPQMWVYDEIALTKTGFTSAAGRCIAMLVEKDGALYSIVALGQSNVKERSALVSDMMHELNINK